MSDDPTAKNDEGEPTVPKVEKTEEGEDDGDDEGPAPVSDSIQWSIINYKQLSLSVKSSLMIICQEEWSDWITSSFVKLYIITDALDIVFLRNFV